MYSYIDTIFPALQCTLSDPADEVVQQCLVVVAEVISSPACNLSSNLVNTGNGTIGGCATKVSYIIKSKRGDT